MHVNNPTIDHKSRLPARKNPELVVFTLARSDIYIPNAMLPINTMATIQQSNDPTM